MVPEKNDNAFLSAPYPRSRDMGGDPTQILVELRKQPPFSQFGYEQGQGQAGSGHSEEQGKPGFVSFDQ